MKTIIKLTGILISICLHTHSFSQKIAIIPEPVSIQQRQGYYFMSGETVIVVASGDPELLKVANYLAAKIKTATGFELKITTTGTNGIQLILNKSADAKEGVEDYSLDASADKIVIKANRPAGIFYGIQTLLQLLPAEIEAPSVNGNVRWQIPAVSILDSPRFVWRGLMLDVSRHFFPKEYIKSYLEQMARYKFNRFHWHLTDDNGWRVEIKSYPRLTEVGAWRVPRTGTFATHEKPKPGEAATYGGFYSQDDIKEIVAYAKDRYIEILPEIDVPGHSMAAIASYPNLCVTKDSTIKVDPGTDFAKWFSDGTFEMNIENTLNPADEKVYEFLDKVYTEVAGLFPFDYIHMGGDECYKGYWERDAGVQAFMKKNNLKDGVALQNYFTKRVSKIIMSKKKKPVGWDEILEGGPAPEAVVMSWRGIKGGIEACQAKRNVVMSPAPYYYLDMCQGDPSIEPPATYLAYNKSRLRDVYDFDMLAPGIDSAYVLGGQGNLWTEQVPTSRQVEYMTYPRSFALSESLWSPESKKNWECFSGKVEEHLKRLDYANISYATSMYDPIINVTKNKSGQLEVNLDTELKDLTVYYTYDNSIPNRYSSAYNNKETIVIPDGADNFRIVSYRDGKPIGKLISFTIEELAKRVK
jgi:hexosaminidase